MENSINFSSQIRSKRHFQRNFPHHNVDLAFTELSIQIMRPQLISRWQHSIREPTRASIITIRRCLPFIPFCSSELCKNYWRKRLKFHAKSVYMYVHHLWNGMIKPLIKIERSAPLIRDFDAMHDIVRCLFILALRVAPHSFKRKQSINYKKIKPKDLSSPVKWHYSLRLAVGVLIWWALFCCGRI